MRSPYAATYFLNFAPRGHGLACPGVPVPSGIITRVAGVCKGGGQSFAARNGRTGWAGFGRLSPLRPPIVWSAAMPPIVILSGDRVHPDQVYRNGGLAYLALSPWMTSIICTSLGDGRFWKRAQRQRHHVHQVGRRRNEHDLSGRTAVVRCRIEVCNCCGRIRRGVARRLIGLLGR
jgi:hypothetical protein